MGPGSYHTMGEYGGYPPSNEGFYPTSLIKYMNSALQTHMNDLPPTMKAAFITGAYIKVNIIYCCTKPNTQESVNIQQ